ncbi:MAG: LysR family transcriptional regulator [Solirubrobacterales bacterium]|nr:LysR family transcriptional regulator [Solirubrobacterales bacterium]MBV9714311.1 LysR family transcriptional regulator [Solirubrobacterales bacterium]
MLDVRRLGFLREVARRGSFTGAAEALGYTQPAVSRQIAVLEAEVGMALVRRVPHGAVLTDAGRLLAERTEAVLRQLTDIEVELRSLAGLRGGSLRLASFASAAASIVPLAIARFRERHPAIELTVMMADPIDTLPRLRAGDLDLALSHDPLVGRAQAADALTVGGAQHDGADVPGHERDGRPALETVHLFDDPMYVAMPVGHRLAEVAPLGLRAFASEPWMLGTTTSCPDSRLFLRACHAAGFEPQIAFQNDDYPAILGFVAAGVGVALIPDMVARGVREDVIVRPLEPAPPARPILAMLPAGYRSPAAAAMLDILHEVSTSWVAARPAGGRPAGGLSSALTGAG